MVPVEIACEADPAVNVHSLVTPSTVVVRTGPIVVAEAADASFFVGRSDCDKKNTQGCHGHKKGKAELGLNVYPRNGGRTVLQGSKHLMDETFASGT